MQRCRSGLLRSVAKVPEEPCNDVSRTIRFHPVKLQPLAGNSICRSCNIRLVIIDNLHIICLLPEIGIAGGPFNNVQRNVIFARPGEAVMHSRTGHPGFVSEIPHILQRKSVRNDLTRVRYGKAIDILLLLLREPDLRHRGGKAVNIDGLAPRGRKIALLHLGSCHDAEVVILRVQRRRQPYRRVPSVCLLLRHVNILPSKSAQTVRGKEELSGLGDERIGLVAFAVHLRSKINGVLPVTVFPVAVIYIETPFAVRLV